MHGDGLAQSRECGMAPGTAQDRLEGPQVRPAGADKEWQDVASVLGVSPLSRGRLRTPRATGWVEQGKGGRGQPGEYKGGPEMREG